MTERPSRRRPGPRPTHSLARRDAPGVVPAGGFGWAQLSRKATPWAFGGLALTALVALGLWADAQLAQRLAAEQMDELRDLLAGALAAGPTGRCDRLAPRMTG